MQKQKLQKVIVIFLNILCVGAHRHIEYYCSLGCVIEVHHLDVSSVHHPKIKRTNYSLELAYIIGHAQRKY